MTNHTADYPVTVELATNGDLDTAPDDYTWDDITRYTDDEIIITRGIPDARTLAEPSRAELTLIGDDGVMVPGRPESPYYPVWTRGAIIRISRGGSVRLTCRVESIRVTWPEANSDHCRISVVAYDLLHWVQQGAAPDTSALTRAVGRFSPVAYWPMEDASGVTMVASGVSGHPALILSGPDGPPSTGESGPAGTEGAIGYTDRGTLSGSIPDYTHTGELTVGFLVYVAAAPSGRSVLIDWAMASTLAHWRVVYDPTGPVWTLEVYNPSGTLVVDKDTSAISPTVVGQWVALMVSAEQNGSDVDYVLRYSTLSGDSSGTATGTATSRTLGKATRLYLYCSAVTGISDYMTAQWVVWAKVMGDLLDSFSMTEFVGYASAWDGETVQARLNRFGGQIGPYIGVLQESGVDTDLLGPQRASDQSSVLQAIADVGGGIIIGTRDPTIYNGWLSYLARSGLYNQAAWEILHTQLSIEFTLLSDDQLLILDSYATRDGGGTARYTITANQYQSAKTYNVYSDEQLPDLASWRAIASSSDLFRLPVISVNLIGNPELVSDYIGIDVGSRISVTGALAQIDDRETDLIVSAIEERHTSVEWEALLTCRPYYPWAATELDIHRLDTDGSEIATAAGATDTTISVSTTANGSPLWTVDDAQFPFDVKCGGERITVTDITPPATPSLQNGTAAHADGTSVVPGLPADLAAGDLMIMLAACRGTSTTITVPSGWDTLHDQGRVKLLGRIATASESAPTVAVTGAAAGDTVSARITRFRNLKITDITNAVVASAGRSTTAARSNLLYPGLVVPHDYCMVLIYGVRSDDWTSVATSTASGASEVYEATSTLGNDQGIVLDRIYQTTAEDIPVSALVVTGGTAAAVVTGVVAIRDDTQTFTVTRSLNGVEKAHSTGAGVSLWTPAILGR